MKYRLLWAVAAAGLAIHLAGLGWDDYRHSQDSTLSARESVIALDNPSHLMIVLGLAVVASSLLGMAAVWMGDHRFGKATFAGGVFRFAALPVIALVAGVALWLASTAESNTRPHAYVAGPVAPRPTTVVDLIQGSVDSSEAVAAEATPHVHDTVSADPNAVEGAASAHEHGAEVAVSGAQLLAAGEFVAELKSHTAQYTDIRAAMADGYVQITQDLPGIAAHFIKPEYQHDGHEMDPDRPEVLLYTKRLDGNWRLVGAMMLAETVSETPPSYFGSLDAWHYHENLCFVAGAAVKVTTSAAECKNGVFVARTPWQMHVWLTGEDSAVFAHDYAPISPGAFPGATTPAAEDFRVQAR
jgi:hypothetical protein